MQSASLITRRFFGIVVLAIGTIITASAQENSPYSRYGLGDLFHGQHIINRGMGGIGVAYSDGQSVNLNNPAALSDIYYVTYDLGLTIESRSLRNADPFAKYNSSNFTPAYLAIGIPLSKKKGWGFAVGLKPVTKINYSVLKAERISGIDSVQTLYEGNGGLNRFFVGISKKWKGFSVGVLGGFDFGRRETSTKRAILNDSIAYYKGNYSSITSFNGGFIGFGIQQEIKLDTFVNKVKGVIEKRSIRLGATATLKQSLSGSEDRSIETFDYDASNAVYKIDSVYGQKNIGGNIKIPATYTAGIQYQKTITDAYKYVHDVFMVGAEYTTTKWSQYTSYGAKDATADSWQLRVGAQWVPDPLNIRSYFSHVKYRAGFNIGKDYINADGNGLKTYGITVGFGLPVRKASYTYQYTTIHTAFEFGKRGSAVNNITENYFRLSVGLSLSDIWFIKRKYD